MRNLYGKKVLNFQIGKKSYDRILCGEKTTYVKRNLQAEKSFISEDGSLKQFGFARLKRNNKADASRIIVEIKGIEFYREVENWIMYEDFFKIMLGNILFEEIKIPHKVSGRLVSEIKEWEGFGASQKNQ